MAASKSKRLPYITKNKLEAWRLYDFEQHFLPVAIDIYKDNAVIHLFERVSQSNIKEVEAFLRTSLKIQDFFYKNRTNTHGAKRSVPMINRVCEANSEQDLKIPPTPSKTITINEYGHDFSINLSDYLDTGIFLDHRETRKWVQEQSKNKVVLNTFAYTGSFSVYAAAGGATKTYSVDLSKTYCEWIKKNIQLNHLPEEKNWVYKMDTFEFFRYAARKKLSFDIIVIDPPTFSRNKGQSFSVQEDHPDLINQALQLLNPGGFIIFSNNKKDFRLSEELLDPCTVRDIQEETIPPDFTFAQTHWCFLIKPA